MTAQYGFCPLCGAGLVVADQAFCAACGQPIPRLPAEPPTVPAPAVARAAEAAKPVAPVVPRGATTNSAGPVKNVRRPGRLTLLVGLVVVVVLAAGAAAAVVLHPWASSGGSAAVPLVAASLDPDAPSFPVPAGSTLLGATEEGTGSAAYRLALWSSPSSYAATGSFYSGLSDSRWHQTGSPATTPMTTDLTFSDSRGVFETAEVEIARTDPVRISVRFLPPGGPPVESLAPGPTRILQQLPAATSLPAGFPAALVPPGTTLIDAGALGTTYVGLFSGTVDLSAYENQFSSVAHIDGTRQDSGSTVIDITYNGQSGQIVVDPATRETSVEVNG